MVVQAPRAAMNAAASQLESQPLSRMLSIAQAKVDELMATHDGKRAHAPTGKHAE